MAAKAPLFRRKALEHYTQNLEKTTLPSFVAPKIFSFLWALLVLLLVATFFVWFEQVPLYRTGYGVVLNQTTTDGQGAKDEEAILFLPVTQSPLQVQNGQNVVLQLSDGSNEVSATVLSVGKTPMSPLDIKQQYFQNVPAAQQITEPSNPIMLQLHSSTSSEYVGSPITAQVQIGTQRIVSLIPQLFN